MKLNILIDMPDQQSSSKYPDIPVSSIEDDVREALDCIESGHDSLVEWKMINKLHKELNQMKKKSPRVQNLLDMMEPVMAKYGIYGVEEES